MVSPCFLSFSRNTHSLFDGQYYVCEVTLSDAARSSPAGYASTVGHIHVGCPVSVVVPAIVAENRSVAAEINAISSIASTFIDTSANQEHLPRCREHFDRGSRAAIPDTSPISDSAIELKLSEQDRTRIVQEIQRLEKKTIIAHVLGLRPTRADLRLLLQAALKQDLDNIIEVQILGRNYYQLEFASERMTPVLLEKKAVAVKGGWISFHKWSHNFSANQVHHDLHSYQTCVVVFPNLRKEWLPSMHVIASSIGTVLEIYEKPRQSEDKYLGAASAKLLISKSTKLPSNILLPNLLDPLQAPYSQKILYRGLPNQCFRCFGFGHLAKYCPKFKEEINKHTTTSAIVPYQNKSEGWTTVKHKKTPAHVSLNKLAQVPINNMQEFPPLQNTYNALQMEDESLEELKNGGHLSFHPPQNLKFDTSFPKLVVGQPPIKIVEEQQNLVMPTNLDRSKENVASKLQVVSDKPKEQPRDIEMNHEHNHVRFQFTQDPLIIHNSEKVVKEHRIHKYAGTDLLFKRQMRAQEGAKKGRQDALLEKRTSLDPM